MTERTDRPETPPSVRADRPRAAGEQPPMQDPHAALERGLIDEFLRMRGQTLRTIAALPPDEMAALLRAAVAHATLRLSEIEARAHFVSELHDSHS